MYRKLLLPTSSEEFKVLEEGPLRASVEVGVTFYYTVRCYRAISSRRLVMDVDVQIGHFQITFGLF